MRDELLRRWVKQEPAPPNVQYLRDAEKNAALDQLGRRKSVLDLASEVNVTRSLRAESVARLDFSSESSAYAEEILDGAVSRYETADPEDPQLPFDDGSFDGAVCIGPYDWKFLATDQLTDELRRVLTDDGVFVFSVPTPRSPYARNDRNRFRYFDPEEALGLLAPDWSVEDYDLLFQYPNPIHVGVNSLPDSTQGKFVTAAERLSDVLTEGGLWEWASYLVISAKPLNYERYLGEGLDCLYRPADQNGFWDPEDGKIIRSLLYEFADDGFDWRVDDSNQWRYAPFAIMGTMRWRSSAVGTDEYDEKIRRELEYFAEQVADTDTLDEMPSYGIGPLIAAFALAAETFAEAEYADVARSLYEYSAETYDFSHSEDSLLLYGWSFLYDHAPEEALYRDISDAMWTITERLQPEGLFAFENHTARRHQNQMYTTWGLCRAIEATGNTGYLDTAEQVLDYTIDVRMRDDGAFIWEDVPLWLRGLRQAKERVLPNRPRHWQFLYECHQTFFVNAVAQYYRAGGTKDYNREVARAMAWIYRTNDLDVDLVELSGLGVPMRFLTTDARMDVPDQMYKGSYEIGSYVMALSYLLDGTFDRLTTA